MESSIILTMSSIQAESKNSSVNSPASKCYPRVLSIAGSDSGGGAGIQADIKTIAALGCYASTAVTALTAQNTLGVQSVHPVPTIFLEEQISSVLDDIGTDSVKVGMFASLENLAAIAKLVTTYDLKNIVFDPVMISSSGTSLVSSGGGALVQGVKTLMRLATLFTPNLSEASFLLGKNVHTRLDMQEAALSLIQLGANAVLIKGGHLLDGPNKASVQVVDVFMDQNLTPIFLESPRIESNNLHGTGCTLSSAIAAYLARGMGLLDAVRAGRLFLLKAVEAGVEAQFGGSGPLNQAFAPLVLEIKGGR